MAVDDEYEGLLAAARTMRIEGQMNLVLVPCPHGEFTGHGGQTWICGGPTLLPFVELLDYLVERGIGRWWDHGDLSPGERRFVSKWLPT